MPARLWSSIWNRRTDDQRLEAVRLLSRPLSVRHPETSSARSRPVLRDRAALDWSLTLGWSPRTTIGSYSSMKRPPGAGISPRSTGLRKASTGTFVGRSTTSGMGKNSSCLTIGGHDMFHRCGNRGQRGGATGRPCLRLAHPISARGPAGNAVHSPCRSLASIELISVLSQPPPAMSLGRAIEGARMVAKGSCLCGGIRYEVDVEGIGAVVNCHCSMCRKATGSAFRTRAAVRADASAGRAGRSRQSLRVLAGRDEDFAHVRRERWRPLPRPAGRDRVAARHARRRPRRQAVRPRPRRLAGAVVRDHRRTATVSRRNDEPLMHRTAHFKTCAGGVDVRRQRKPERAGQARRSPRAPRRCGTRGANLEHRKPALVLRLALRARLRRRRDRVRPQRGG